MNFLLTIPTLAWFAFAMLAYFVAEYWSKLWGDAPTWQLALLINIAYTVSTIGWLAIMAERKQLILMSMFWYLMGGIVSVLVGYVLFHEHLSPLQWAGVGTTVISVMLLSS